MRVHTQAPIVFFTLCLLLTSACAVLGPIDKKESRSKRYPVQARQAFLIAASVLCEMDEVSIEPHPKEGVLYGGHGVGATLRRSQVWIDEVEPKTSGEMSVSVAFADRASYNRPAESEFFSKFEESLKRVQDGKPLPCIQGAKGQEYLSKDESFLYSTGKPGVRYVNSLDEPKSVLEIRNAKEELFLSVPLVVPKESPPYLDDGKVRLHSQVARSTYFPELHESLDHLSRSRFSLSVGYFAAGPFPNNLVSFGVNYSVTRWMMVRTGMGMGSCGGISFSLGGGVEFLPYRFVVGRGKVIGPVVGVGYSHYVRGGYALFGVTGADFATADLGILFLSEPANLGVQFGIQGSLFPLTAIEPGLTIYFNPF